VVDFLRYAQVSDHSFRRLEPVVDFLRWAQVSDHSSRRRERRAADRLLAPTARV
jgi:hypothetical protein